MNNTICECIYSDINGKEIICNNVATKINITVTRFDFVIDNDTLIDKCLKINICDTCYNYINDINNVGKWDKKLPVF